ncbi:MAG: NYN domain-containing protein, partial [Lachnospiraceae bacterium]|nr:NYN domain-containing protein [Lachnospiraceae bacterium]
MDSETISRDMLDRNFALLIDGDNVSPKYISGIIEEMTTKYGNLSYRRIYGDFTKTAKNSWKDVLLDNSITPIQQYNNTVGKNSSDSALIIDAMDILYSGKVDGFCIVSSDSDFTRLASRLRESRMYVVVMGEDKTPRSIRMACDKFVTLENLIDQDESDSGKKKDSKKKPTATLTRAFVNTVISDIIADNDNNGRATHLGELGSKLVAIYPDFDTRNYGYSSLSRMIEETKEFNLYKNANAYYGSLKEDTTKKDVYALAVKLIKDAGKKGLDIGELSNRIHAEIPSFTPKAYGYS